MALIQTVYSGDLYNLACDMNRGKNFGYSGWQAIGDYLENRSDEIGEDVEIDIIAICCDYSMAESADEAWEQVVKFGSIDDEEWEEMEEDEMLAVVSDYLQENTALIICEDDLIIWKAF